MGSPRGFRRAPEHGGRKAGCANSAPALAFPLPPRRFLSRLGPPPPLCLPLRAGRVVVIFRRQVWEPLQAGSLAGHRPRRPRDARAL